jgi:hypothetical protein
MASPVGKRPPAAHMEIIAGYFKSHTKQILSGGRSKFVNITTCDACTVVGNAL